MPWREVSIMSAREEFVMLAMQPGANKAELCRRFGISRPTGDKWIERYRTQGRAGLADRSRQPLHSPLRTSARLEEAIVAARQAHPAWGARTLKAWMRTQGHPGLPAHSTFQAIFRRNGLIDPAASLKRQPFLRFEQPHPNALWQMDFKGHFALADGGRCHPLTVLDDHSRFNLCLKACANEQHGTVQAALSDTFRYYGLPDSMIMDNGAPWGDSAEHPFTRLGVWLIRLGIWISHSRPYHPQTLGKDERLHRTLDVELLRRERFDDLSHAQRRFDAWRDLYNLERPHQALQLTPPISRYRPSPRTFPEPLSPVEYLPGDIVRKIQDHGQLHYRGRIFRVGKAFRGQPVALRPTPDQDATMDVFFCHQRIAQLDLRVNKPADV